MPPLSNGPLRHRRLTTISRGRRTCTAARTSTAFQATRPITRPSSRQTTPEMQIPYTVEPRPDTGLYNAKLGIWLLLASELMLFAGLFSSYVLLRTGAVEWPRHVLPVAVASVNTAVLIASSLT